MLPRAILRRLDPALLLVMLAALLAPPAHATTLLSVGGEGLLELEVGGDLFIDLGGASLVDVALTASDGLVIGEAPYTLPSDPDDIRSFLDLSGNTSLAFTGDVYFDAFDFSGSIAFAAENIFVNGSLAPAGDVALNVPGLLPGDLCGGDAGGLTIRSGDADCPLVAIDGPIVIDGPIDVTPPPLPSPSPAVPEPRAAVLFSIGAGVMLASTGRRARSSG